MRKLLLPLAVLLAAGFSSCSKDEAAGCPEGSGNDTLRIQLSKDTVERNGFDYVRISVLDSSGNDVTTKCTIYANNVAISRNYVPAGLGNQTITAKTECQVSDNRKLVVVPAEASPFSQKVMVEDLTSANCGFCTRVAHTLETFKEHNPGLIVVGVHSDGYPDPFAFKYYPQIASKFRLAGLPSVVLNRQVEWDEDTTALKNILKRWAPLGMSIVSTKNNDGTVSGTVNVKFNVTTEKSMKLVIALVENGLVYPQLNYYSSNYPYRPYLYGGVSPVNNFVHNGVLRKTSTDLFGDAIPASAQIKGSVYSKDFSFTLTGTTYDGTQYNANIDNVGIVAFVVDGSGSNGAYNVQYANAGVTQEYD